LGGLGVRLVRELGEMGKTKKQKKGGMARSMAKVWFLGRGGKRASHEQDGGGRERDEWRVVGPLGRGGGIKVPGPEEARERRSGEATQGGGERGGTVVGHGTEIKKQYSNPN